MSNHLDCRDHLDDVTATDIHTWSDADVEAYVNCLKMEADRHWSIDSNISLQYAQKIMDIGQQLKRPAYVALGMMARGDALKNLGQANAALEALTQAGTLYQQVGDDVGWARTRIGMVYIASDVKRVEETLQEAAVAREILLANGQMQRCVYLDMNVATLYGRLGDAQSALVHYDCALELAHQLGENFAYLLWPIHYNRAVLWTETGDLRRAEASFDEAIENAREQGATRNLIFALTGRARLYVFQGKHRKALLMVHEAKEIAQDAFPLERLFLQRIMAECYLHLNRYREGRMLALDTASAFEEQGYYYEAALCFYHIAQAELHLDNFEQSVKSLDYAEAYLIRADDAAKTSLWKSRQYALRGWIAFKSGEYATAEKWLLKTLESCEKDSVIHIATLLAQAELFITQQKYAQAQAIIEQTQRSAQDKNLTQYVYKAHLLTAAIAEQTAAIAEAVARYQQAVALIEEAQKDLIISLRSDFLADKTEAIHKLIQLAIRQGDVQKAFVTLERMKSHVLMNYLSNRESLYWRSADESTSHLLGTLDSLRSEYRWYMSLLHQDVQSDALPEAKIAADVLHSKLSQCERQIREITEQLYLLNEDTSHLGLQVLPTLLDIQSQLDTADVLIEYYNDDRNYWVFVVTHNDVKIHKLAANSTAIDQLISKLQPNLTWALDVETDDPLYQKLLVVFQQLSQRLYEYLLGELDTALTAAIRLWIVPFGSLHYVPFTSLFDGQQYLIEKHEVIILPTSSILVQSYPVQTGKARILAHSWNQAIPNTISEAERVMNLWGGEIYLEDETRRSILMEEPVQILHIAAHGEHRMDVPQLSYIQLGDGQVFMDDLLQEDLSYELVVLSGCETGRATVMPGDELIGIGRGILLSGAASLIASLWHVNDDIMPDMIATLYHYLAQGVSKSQALRQAQLSVLDQQPDCHPAYWSALQFTGNPRPMQR